MFVKEAILDYVKCLVREGSRITVANEDFVYEEDD